MTFYFYDLETSGLSSTAQRIMQFGGIRTDENFNIVDEPFECYVKLTDEVLPDPSAILVTGISPQKTIEEGYEEPEFIKILNEKVFQPNTVIVGYNNIRFDDEFIRHLMWRNLNDPYEWHWKDGRSRWDLVDATRMMRALRPEGVEWPVDADGKPTNKLDKLTIANKIEHSGAHTALADVEALIEFAKKLKSAQPRLFEYLVKNRDKKSVSEIVDLNNPKPFVHSSGKMSSEWLSTSVFYPLFKSYKNPQAIICYDLRFSINGFESLSVEELSQRLYVSGEELKNKDQQRLPVKGVHLNKCPAVAPIGVLDEASQRRIELNIPTVQKNLKELQQNSLFIEKIKSVYDSDENGFEPSDDVDQQMYDSFVGDKDRIGLAGFVKSSDFDKYQNSFIDERLNRLMNRHKARFFKDQLSEKEKAGWQAYRQKRIQQGMRGALGAQEFLDEIAKLRDENKGNKQKMFLLDELELYLSSIAD